LGEKLGIAQSLHQLGNIEYYERNYDEARRLYEKSLALNGKIGNRLGEGMSINMLGILDEAQNRMEPAEKHYDEAYEIFNALGRKEDSASAKKNLDRVRSKKQGTID
jgi:tetratricopeptide (TPR) repeat protein